MGCLSVLMNANVNFGFRFPSTMLFDLVRRKSHILGHLQRHDVIGSRIGISGCNLLADAT